MEKGRDKRSVCLFSDPGKIRKHPWTHSGAGLKSDASITCTVDEKTSISQILRLILD